MIFVTVGTHEQQFDRLVREVDRLREDRLIEDEVVIQTGFSIYEPAFCEWNRLYPYRQMVILQTARIYIDTSGKVPGWRSAVGLHCKFNRRAV